MYTSRDACVCRRSTVRRSLPGAPQGTDTPPACAKNNQIRHYKDALSSTVQIAAPAAHTCRATEHKCQVAASHLRHDAPVVRTCRRTPHTSVQSAWVSAGGGAKGRDPPRMEGVYLCELGAGDAREQLATCVVTSAFTPTVNIHDTDC
jgi:hypothetical protein